MKTVLKQIERTQWQQKPVGPMAQHVKLKDADKQWARPVNMALEHQFRAFCVSSKADQGKLVRILNEAYRGKKMFTPQVLLARDEPRFTDIDRDRPRDARGRPFRTIDDVLDVDHDQVHNMLVVHAAIHRQILQDDPEATKEMAFGRDAAKNRFYGRLWDGVGGDTFEFSGPTCVTVQ